MRFRSSSLGLWLAGGMGLLAACSKEPVPVRLDFVGYTNLTSSDRTAGVADTFRTIAFAEKGTDGAALDSFRIRVTYSPEAGPVVYPTLLSSFKPSTGSTTLKMLDSALTDKDDFIFRPTFGARSTSGTERWQYTVTDKAGHSVTRSYRLVVRKSDSTAVYHSYTLLPRLVPGVLGRPYLLLRPGLVLPRFAVNHNETNQDSVDLIVVASANGALSLQSPDAATLPTSWTGSPRATELRLTSLDNNGFGNVNTATGLADAFNAAPASAIAGNSGTLVQGKVYAFHTTGTGSRYGLLYLSNITQTPFPLLTCLIRMQK